MSRIIEDLKLQDSVVLETHFSLSTVLTLLVLLGLYFLILSRNIYPFSTVVSTVKDWEYKGNLSVKHCTRARDMALTILTEDTHVK